jgi:hypothetical protein
VPESSLVTIVIGISGVVAIVGVGLVVSTLRPVPSRRPLTDHPHGSSPAASASDRVSGWSVIPFRRRRRSVAGNLQRAIDRIEAVDPYATQRRIGEALTDAGLTSAAPADTERRRPGHTWPFGLVSGQRGGKGDT